MKKILTKFIIIFAALLAQGCAFADFSFKDMELSFVQISDTHISDREDTSYKALSSSKALLEDAVKQTNDIKNLDFVAFTGDMVDAPLKKSYRDFFILASKLKTPMFTTFGNHDIAQTAKKADSELLTKQEALSIINKCNPYFAFGSNYYAFSPKEDYRVIVLDTSLDSGEVTANGYISPDELNFLDDQLEKYQDKVIIIFQHHPVAEPFKSEHHRIKNQDDYLTVLKKYKKTPIMILSGHYHAAKIERQGNIIHVSTPSLVTFPNAFRYVNITNFNDRAIFNIKYLETGLKEIQNQSKLSAIASATLKGVQGDHEAQITIRKNRAYKQVESKIENQPMTKEDRLLQKQIQKAERQEKRQQKAELKAKKKLEKMNEIQKDLYDEASEMSGDIELLRQN